MHIVKSRIKSIPGVKKFTRNTHNVLNNLACAAVQRAIATREGHDILVLLGMRRSGR